MEAGQERFVRESVRGSTKQSNGHCRTAAPNTIQGLDVTVVVDVRIQRGRRRTLASRRRRAGSRPKEQRADGLPSHVGGELQCDCSHRTAKVPQIEPPGVQRNGIPSTSWTTASLTKGISIFTKARSNFWRMLCEVLILS